MRERPTNTFSQQDRTLPRQQNKRHHCGPFKFLGNFEAKYLPCIIAHASFAEHQMMIYSNPNNKPIVHSPKQERKGLFADHHSEFRAQHNFSPWHFTKIEFP